MLFWKSLVLLSPVSLLSYGVIAEALQANHNNALSEIVNRDNASTWWKPAAGTTWQIVLREPLNDISPKVTVFDIDLFTNNQSTIDALHKKGSKVICYFSAGSYEDYRPDSSNFTKDDYRNPLKEWEGEWWVDTNSKNVRNIMLSRIELAKSKSCDGVDPDNVDGYSNDTGFNLTQADAVDYVKFMADAAHSRGMAIGLKNAGAIIPDIIDEVEWDVNEQCEQYNECQTYRPFIDANKPVFHLEYPASAPNVSASTESTICSDPQAAGFSTLIKELALLEWYYDCSSGASSANATSPTPSSTPKSNDAVSRFGVYEIIIAAIAGLVAVL